MCPPAALLLLLVVLVNTAGHPASPVAAQLALGRHGNRRVAGLVLPRTVAGQLAPAPALAPDCGPMLLDMAGAVHITPFVGVLLNVSAPRKNAWCLNLHRTHAMSGASYAAGREHTDDRNFAQKRRDVYAKKSVDAGASTLFFAYTQGILVKI